MAKTSESGDFIPPMKHCLHSGYHQPSLRAWQSSNTGITPDNLMYPVFVTDSAEDAHDPIPSLPGNARYGVKKLCEHLRPLVSGQNSLPLKSILIFGVPTKCIKDDQGSAADDENGPVVRAIKTVRKEFPDLLIAVDVCLCAYTSERH